jgi:hypothetical protein
MTQNIDKPNAATPASQGSFNSFMPLILPDPSIKRDSFNELINNRGIRFFHSKAYPCSNMKTLDDNAHDMLCPHCDGSGILYYDRREIFGLFSSNSIDRQFEKNGVWEMGTVVVTLPTEYPDGTEADFSMFDKLEVQDFTVRLYELKEYEPREDGKQQLRYPIIKTSRVEAVTHEERREFKEGIDFTIEDGKIKWVSGRTPNYNQTTEHGQVYSVNYYCKPVYIVLNPLRELRVTQESEGLNKQARRLPQQLVLRRDFYVNAPEKVK